MKFHRSRSAACGEPGSRFARADPAVADDLRAFDRDVNTSAWPSAPCPRCKVGDLHVVRGKDGRSTLERVQSADSSEATLGEDWEPESWCGVFHRGAGLRLAAVREPVVVVGDWGTEQDDRGGFDSDGVTLPWTTG